MNGDPDIYEPRLRTAALEEFLRALGCVKGDCTSRICIWKTPRKKRGIMVPNPQTVPSVPYKTRDELMEKITLLDADSPDGESSGKA